MPVLENSQGQLVYESAITCEYLDEVYPGKKLLPEDPYEKACQKMTFELFSKVCGEEISVPVWKKPLLFKLPRCCHLQFSNLERIILLSALTCPPSPFLISFCLPLQSYPFSPFSQHFIFQPYWIFQFSQTRHLTSSCWEGDSSFSHFACLFQILFHVSAHILLPSRSLSRLGECPALFSHILTFLFWWLPAFWPVCYYTRAVSSLRVRAVFPSLLAYCLPMFVTSSATSMFCDS